MPSQVTPGILQLVSHSKVLAEMVNLHFLSLMEALMECHSTILAKLLPLWTPVFHAYQVKFRETYACFPIKINQFILQYLMFFCGNHFS